MEKNIWVIITVCSTLLLASCSSVSKQKKQEEENVDYLQPIPKISAEEYTISNFNQLDIVSENVSTQTRQGDSNTYLVEYYYNIHLRSGARARVELMEKTTNQTTKEVEFDLVYTIQEGYWEKDLVTRPNGDEVEYIEITTKNDEDYPEFWYISATPSRIYSSFFNDGESYYLLHDGVTDAGVAIKNIKGVTE